MKHWDILIIDGQGGRIGKLLIEGAKSLLPGVEITAVGTNSIATGTMMKAGADHGATGENAVLVACRHADIIVGPIGIVVADSLVGEVSPAMAAAVGQSSATKLLIPLNLCNNIVIGVPDLSITHLVELTLRQLQLCCNGEAER